MQKATPHMPSQTLPERWFLVDAKDKVPGRLAVKVTKLLMGKDKATFNRAVDAKTNVVIINAGSIKFTGNKLAGKTYVSHSGYPGGLREKTPAQVLAGSFPTRVVSHAIAGMLPKNKLGTVMLKRLKVYAGSEHPHAGQNPITVDL